MSLKIKLKNDKNHTEFDHELNNLANDVAKIFDLDETESKIYVNLLKTGPITASALAKELNVDRSGTYRIIDKMISVGIISTTFSTPKLCIPLSPDNVLKMMIQKKEDSIKAIKNKSGDILQRIQSITTSDFSSKVPVFRVIHGRDNVFYNISRMIENATGIVYIVSNLEDISKMYYSSIPEKITICEKNGGEVRLLVNMNDIRFASFVKRFGATKTRIGNTEFSGRIVIEKGKQMIMSDTRFEGKPHNNKSDFSLYTNSYDMVNNIQNLCQYLWTDSKSIKTININDFTGKQSMRKHVRSPKNQELFEIKELKQVNSIMDALLKTNGTTLQNQKS